MECDWCYGRIIVAGVLLLYSGQPVTGDDIVVRTPCTNTSTWRDEQKICYAEVAKLHDGAFYSTLLNSPTEEKLETICSAYQKWIVCIKALYETCNIRIQDSANSLKLAQRLVAKTCNDRKQNTLHNLPCLVSQSGEANPLFRGCYSLMELQTESGVFDMCMVAREYIECEDRLLRSACGSDLADFSLAISIKSKFTELGVNDKCSYTPLTKYNGFSYTMHCSPDFPVRMRECYDNFQVTKVALYHSMLAIIRGTEAELDNWCRAYRQYERCLAPISEACPGGVQEVYTTENEWHRIVMVAHYLCGPALTDYKHFLPCYKKMMRHSNSFNLCRKVFDKYPTKYEAYQVKCSPTRSVSRENMQKREKLIECFSAFMGRECTANGSATIEPLIRMQYSFDFLPPCEKSSIDSCPNAIRSRGFPLIYNITVYLPLSIYIIVYLFDRQIFSFTNEKTNM